MRLLFAAALLATAASPVLADTRGFSVAGFDRVRSSGPFDVRIHTGQRPGVHADGPKEMLDRLRIEVRGGELQIGTQPGHWFSGWTNWGKRQRTVIDVAVPMVLAVALAGPGDITVDRVRARNFSGELSGPGNLTIGTIETGRLDLSLSGPGDITASGRAAQARIALSGPGDVRARGLTVGDLDVSLSGPGDIAVTALHTATGHVSGPGDVTVAGGAHCSISKSGPGDVHCG